MPRRRVNGPGLDTEEDRSTMHHDDTPADRATPPRLPRAARMHLWWLVWEDLLSPLPPAAEPPMPAAPKPKRQRKPDPSRLAKWEAHWQADAPEGDQ